MASCRSPPVPGCRDASHSIHIDADRKVPRRAGPARPVSVQRAAPARGDRQRQDTRAVGDRNQPPPHLHRHDARGFRRDRRVLRRRPLPRPRPCLGRCHGAAHPCRRRAGTAQTAAARPPHRICDCRSDSLRDGGRLRCRDRPRVFRPSGRRAPDPSVLPWLRHLDDRCPAAARPVRRGQARHRPVPMRRRDRRHDAPGARPRPRDRRWPHEGAARAAVDPASGGPSVQPQDDFNPGIPEKAGGIPFPTHPRPPPGNARS